MASDPSACSVGASKSEHRQRCGQISAQTVAESLQGLAGMKWVQAWEQPPQCKANQMDRMPLHRSGMCSHMCILTWLECNHPLAHLAEICRKLRLDVSLNAVQDMLSRSLTTPRLD